MMGPIEGHHDDMYGDAHLRHLPPGQRDMELERRSGYPDQRQHHQQPHKEIYPLDGSMPEQQRLHQLQSQQQQQQLQQQQQQQQQLPQMPPQPQQQHRRGSVGRSGGDRTGQDLDDLNTRSRVDHHEVVYGQEMIGPGIAANVGLGERHPERLMRGGHMLDRGGPKDVDVYDQLRGQQSQPSPHANRRGDVRDGRNDHHRDVRDQHGREEFHDMDMDMDRYPDRSSRQHLDPSSAVAKTSRSRRKLDSMLRNDSLSSDPSDCVRPPPPKPHKHKKGKNKPRQSSFSSSDDEIQTTPECTSCDEQEIESESVSEKGKSVY